MAGKTNNGNIGSDDLKTWQTSINKQLENIRLTLADLADATQLLSNNLVSSNDLLSQKLVEFTNTASAYIKSFSIYASAVDSRLTTYIKAVEESEDRLRNATLEQEVSFKEKGTKADSRASKWQ